MCMTQLPRPVMVASISSESGRGIILKGMSNGIDVIASHASPNPYQLQ